MDGQEPLLPGVPDAPIQAALHGYEDHDQEDDRHIARRLPRVVKVHQRHPTSLLSKLSHNNDLSTKNDGHLLKTTVNSGSCVEPLVKVTKT